MDDYVTPAQERLAAKIAGSKAAGELMAAAV
jgi:hypothetical protein